MKTTKPCDLCGKEFTRYHAANQSPKYCSRSCASSIPNRISSEGRAKISAAVSESNRKPGRMTAETRAKIGSAMTAERHPNWTGGQWTSNEGRVFIRVPVEERHLHPTIRKDGYIQRYQYVWNTAHPEDPVRVGDVIHHKDEDRQNDAIENLKKTTQSEHATHHGTGRRHTEESRERMRKAQLDRRARERLARG